MIQCKHLHLWLAAMAFWAAGMTPCKGQSQSAYLPDSSLDFGSVRQGEVVEHRFTMRNPGTVPAAVRIMGLSHPGMKVRMPQTLPPGESGSITLTWDTRFVQGDTTVQALLRFADTERVIVNLSAKVVPPVDILPYPAVFLSGFRGESTTTSLEIVNNEAAPLNVVGITSDKKDADPGYSATFTTLEPGHRHALNIELTSSAPAGKSQGVLLVLTDNARFPVIRIPVNLLVKDDVYVNPESLDFGIVADKAQGPETFLLKSRALPIKIVSITSNLSYLRVTHKEGPDVAALTHEFQVELEFADLKPGLFSGMIFIKTDDSDLPELKVPVRGEVR